MTDAPSTPALGLVTLAARRAELDAQCLDAGHDFAVLPVAAGPGTGHLDDREPAFVICVRCGRNWDLQPATPPPESEGVGS